MLENSTVDKVEIEHFSKDSSKWWDENGPFKPLHKINPVRLGYIRNQIISHFSLDKKSLKALTGLKIADVGCGGGLICEPMARLGADVTAVDADENAIITAREHAKESGLDIDYSTGTAETLLSVHEGKFDVVLALEIVEHVNNINDFVKACTKLCKSGGIIIFSTINRTPKSFALGIVAAEYLLRWVPQGTHNWNKFVKPSELSSFIRKNNGNISDISGMKFNMLSGEFEIANNDIDVNYFITVVK
jgi:2-polyprenyl-6-hydroxyphenyl methylase/3-demethylubiquinone-9 3-methyltransferase